MTFLRQAFAGLRLLLVMTVLLGLLYPAVITVIAQVAINHQANGSLIKDSNGQVVGSALLGQKFDDPTWFQSRPSASDYSGETSGGSNLSPASQKQLDARAQREADLKAANPDAVGPVPEDALTASATGLDPYVSVAYAQWQLPRVAKARGMSAAELQVQIGNATYHAVLGYIGQDAVNVTQLNLALAKR
jgi:K+-transporting ATPase ATPase C chain